MSQDGRLLLLLKSQFGYDRFRPGQEEVVTHVLSGGDALVLMPTAGGKSLCYQLPALCLDGLTLVVSPLVALMKDQVDALRANGVEAAYINSTLSVREAAEVQSWARNGRLRILYVAPERIALAGFRAFLHSVTVSLVAIDEAHCISEWGHDFRPDYRNLKGLRDEFPEAPIIALTATATEQVRRDIIGQLGLRRERSFVSSFNRPNLAYAVLPKERPLDALLDLLRRHREGSVVVYRSTRKDTESLASYLTEKGMMALPYHAGLDAEVRRETQDGFIHGQARIIVATVAFGMGVDVPDVRLVVHFDLPKTIEAYYQETGRAGRDGLPSECVLFYSPTDKTKQDYHIDRMEDPIQQETARRKLAQVVEYSELQTCRRRFLLQYFGEEWHEAGCGSCDVCQTPREEQDATEIAQKVLSAVYRTDNRFGASHVISVLRGSRSKKLRDLGHHKLSVFGIARNFSEGELKEIIVGLVARGLLSKNGDRYPTVSLTEAGMEFLKRREKLTLTLPKREFSAVEREPRPSSRPAFEDADLEYHPELLKRLRTLRRELADAQGVPAFVVFHDDALREMALHLPQTPESFAQVEGVGNVKLARYSGGFLEVIREYVRENGTVQGPQATRAEKPAAARGSAGTFEETRRLLAEKLNVPEIASCRGLTGSTIRGHLERMTTAGESLDIAHMLPPADRIASITAAFRKAGSLEYLSPARELLGEEYSYDELALVRIHLRQIERSSNQDG